MQLIRKQFHFILTASAAIVSITPWALVKSSRRSQMTDLNPEIWNNPTLGKAAHNERLDRLEKQQHEDRAARLENREPREVVVENDYPDWTPQVQERTGTVPSNAVVVHFADEQPHDVVQTGPNIKPEGMSDEEWAAQENSPESEEGAEEPFVSSDNETPTDDNESNGPVSSEESDSTQWT
jgi:hypothetical protein